MALLCGVRPLGLGDRCQTQRRQRAGLRDSGFLDEAEKAG